MRKERSIRAYVGSAESDVAAVGLEQEDAERRRYLDRVLYAEIRASRIRRAREPLSAADVARIRAEYSTGNATQKQIAYRYGVPQVTIHRLVKDLVRQLQRAG